MCRDTKKRCWLTYFMCRDTKKRYRDNGTAIPNPYFVFHGWFSGLSGKAGEPTSHIEIALPCRMEIATLKMAWELRKFCGNKSERMGETFNDDPDIINNLFPVVDLSPAFILSQARRPFIINTE